MNCWIRHPSLCQVVHPWHWLAYGQNAAVVAGLAAILSFFVAASGLVGLYFYTKYTKTMMETNIDSLNASFRPLIKIEIVAVDVSGMFQMRLTNVGKGVATQIFFGCAALNGGAVLNQFVRFSYFDVKSIQRGGSSNILVPGDWEDFNIQGDLHADHNLILVNCLDAGLNIVQTAYLCCFKIINHEAMQTGVTSFAILPVKERIRREKKLGLIRTPEDIGLIP